MNISFSALEQSIKKIQEIKKLEKVLIIDGKRVVLRCLDQSEEVDQMEFMSLLAQKFDDLKFSKSSQSAMGLALRVSLLAYSIVEIDGINLRGVEYVDLPDETQVAKRDALANLIAENWDSDFTQRIFQMYLMWAMEESLRVMDQVELDTKTLEDQKSFHEQRLEMLNSRLEAAKVQTMKEKLLISEEEESPEESPPSPEVREVPPENPPKVTNLPPIPQREQTQPQAWEEIQSSFISEDDPNSILIEEARIRAQQKAALQKKEPQPPTLNRGLPQIANLQQAFQTNSKIIIRQPEETLEEPENPTSGDTGGVVDPFRR